MALAFSKMHGIGNDFVLIDCRERSLPLDTAARAFILLGVIEPPSALNGVVLIDEIDAHLHPEWQRGLLDALRAMAPEAQIILATHSPEIWDQVYSFERFFLGAPGDPRVIRNAEAESA